MSRAKLPPCPDCGGTNVRSYTLPGRNDKGRGVPGRLYCASCWRLFDDPTVCETCRGGTATHIASNPLHPDRPSWRVCVRCAHPSDDARAGLIYEPIERGAA